MPSKILDDLVACKVPTETIAAVASLIAEVEQAHERAAITREQNRKRQQNHRARNGDKKACHGDSHGDIQKHNGINGHVTVTNEGLLSFLDSKKERKKESQNFKSDFELFYAAYPKKVGKIEAEKAYAKARKRATHAEIMVGLQKQKPGFSDPQFIPYPATWLNKGRWLDEIAVNRQLSSVI